MGAALRRGNQVDVTFLGQFTLGQPGYGEVDAATLALLCPDVGLHGQAFGIAEHGTQVVAQAVFVVPIDVFAARLVLQAHVESRAQHGLGAQHVLEFRQRDLR